MSQQNHSAYDKSWCQIHIILKHSNQYIIIDLSSDDEKSWDCQKFFEWIQKSSFQVY